MPTILDLVGVPAPPTVEGRSLVPLLDGAPHAADDTVSELLQSPIKRVYRTVRRDDLTYVVDGGVERVFDRRADPGETTDVASSRPDLLAAGRAALARWRDASAGAAARFAPRRSAAPDAETLRRLRALGYVE
jgi:arylsulfatase A-like enzyme